MSYQNERLSYRDLDPSLTVVGIEVNDVIIAHGFNDCNGRYGDSWADTLGRPVYYNPDRGWMRADTGRPVKS
jgi:hypothetical protein